jgi:hypothetical protein
MKLESFYKPFAGYASVLVNSADLKNGCRSVECWAASVDAFTLRGRTEYAPLGGKGPTVSIVVCCSPLIITPILGR